MAIIPQYSGQRVSLRPRTRLVSPARCLPIPGKDVIAQMGVRVNVADLDLLDRIETATEHIERYTGRDLVSKRYDLYLDDVSSTWPSAFSSSWLPLDSPFRDPALNLPRSPLLSVLGVYTTTEDGTETTVDPLSYSVSKTGEPGRIALTSGYSWPYHRGIEGFRVRFATGYVAPFQADSGTLTVPDNPFVGGEILRVSRGLNDGFPGGLQERTPYTVTNVQGNTLQLLDEDGVLMDTVDTTQLGGYSFLGEIPAPIRHEIALMAAGRDMEAKEERNQKKVSSKQGPVHWVEGFEERLKYFRQITI